MRSSDATGPNKILSPVGWIPSYDSVALLEFQ
jgi:hypothetical protein